MLRLVDVAVRHPPAQRVGGHVDQLDLVGGADHLVRDGLLLPDPGDPLDLVVERLEVLDVDGGDDVDAGGTELLDVLRALLVPAAGHVGVRELVDQHHGRVAGQHRVDVHLGEGGTAVGDLAPRHDLQSVDLRGRVLPVVGLDEPDDHVGAAGEPPVRLTERRVGLADPGRGAEVDGQAPSATVHVIHCGPQAFAAASRTAMLSSSTLTCGSPRTPQVRPEVFSSTRSRTVGLAEPVRLRRPAAPGGRRTPPRCRGRDRSRRR